MQLFELIILESVVAYKWLQETFCNSIILLLRSTLSSLDFLVVLSVCQSSDCHQTNPLYAGKEKLPDQLWLLMRSEQVLASSDTAELSAPLIKILKFVYVCIPSCMYISENGAHLCRHVVASCVVLRNTSC